MENIKKKNLRKKFFILIIFYGILIVVIATIMHFFGDDLFKNDVEILEENQDAMFNVNKIQYYSDVSATSNQTTYQNPEWNLDVYQYTDIAIYIERITDFSTENYIKSLYIDNIKISETKEGVQKIYYLNPLNFGKNDILEENAEAENEINNKLEYNIINYENKENDIGYSIPIFFEDCSNPITLRYVNLDILKDYTISTNEQIKFDGSLLKNANISLDDIQSTISLDLNIITEAGDKHSMTLSLDIPLNNENSDIYDGPISITKENLENNF